MSAALDRTMADVLLGLELLSFGSTQAWNPSGGQSGEVDDKMVAQVATHPTFPHIEWRQRYEEATSDSRRESVIRAARAELELWTGRGRSALPAGSITEDEIIVADYVGWSPEEVAQTRKVTPRMVRNARSAAKRDPLNGQKLEAEEGDADRARSLAEQGLTQKQIAALLGVSQPTVSRLVGHRREV